MQHTFAISGKLHICFVVGYQDIHRVELRSDSYKKNVTFHFTVKFGINSVKFVFKQIKLKRDEKINHFRTNYFWIQISYP